MTVVLSLVAEIGSGQFGQVQCGKECWTNLQRAELEGGVPPFLVAAKTVLDSKESPENTRDLQSEAVVMAQVGHHANLVSLVGVTPTRCRSLASSLVATRWLCLSVTASTAVWQSCFTFMRL